jgi:hypothetical protein
MKIHILLGFFNTLIFQKKDFNPYPNALCSVYVWISKDGFSLVQLGLVKLGQVRAAYEAGNHSLLILGLVRIG